MLRLLGAWTKIERLVRIGFYHSQISRFGQRASTIESYLTRMKGIMKLRSLARCLSALGLAILLLSGAASAADVYVMISAGFYGVYSELGPAFERASGHHLHTTRGPSMGDSPEAIPTRLAQGETADDDQQAQAGAPDRRGA